MTAYENTSLNSKLFGAPETGMESEFKSVRWFFTEEYLKKGMSFLDVGGAAGNLAAAIKKEIVDVRPTIIDPDIKNIQIGENRFPFEFIHGYFPDEARGKYDVVSMQHLFPQLPDWKQILLSMAKHARKYINFSCILKLHGTTVIDKDISYVYYFESGERVHQVVHNIYEILNFLCIHEMKAKKIEFYGYHTPYAGDNFRCVPNDEQIKGNFMIELFEENKNPIRMGAGSDKGADDPGYKFFIPEINILIDDKPFCFR